MSEAPLLEAEAVTCRFGRMTACRDINVAVYAGEILLDRSGVSPGRASPHCCAVLPGGAPHYRSRDLHRCRRPRTPAPRPGG
ncbi:MAG: hypothetical protein U5L11_17000 [Arhodomonas sp.]|nr:hypothetical protein [Arhodomonas sp.]